MAQIVSRPHGFYFSLEFLEDAIRSVGGSAFDNGQRTEFGPEEPHTLDDRAQQGRQYWRAIVQVKGEEILDSEIRFVSAQGVVAGPDWRAGQSIMGGVVAGIHDLVDLVFDSGGVEQIPNSLNGFDCFVRVEVKEGVDEDKGDGDENEAK